MLSDCGFRHFTVALAIPKISYVVPYSVTKQEQFGVLQLGVLQLGVLQFGVLQLGVLQLWPTQSITGLPSDNATYMAPQFRIRIASVPRRATSVNPDHA